MAAAAAVDVAAEVAFVPSERGEIGVFAMQGFFPAGSAPSKPVDGGNWTLVSNRNAVLDLNHPKTHTGSVAFLKVDVVASDKGRYYALLGVDDGVTVLVDGAPVYARDEARPYRDDDDMVPLDLDAGRHTIVLRLHQRDGAWLVRARFLGKDLLPSPALSFRLPRAIVKEDDFLALSSVNFDRGLSPDGVLHPRLVVQFPAGLADGARVLVQAKIKAADNTLFSSYLTEGRATKDRAPDAQVELPALSADDVGDRADKVRLELDVGSRHLSLPIVAPRVVLDAYRRARAEIARGPHDALDADAIATIELSAQRLERFVAGGDTDVEALVLEANDVLAVVAAAERGEDLFAKKRGPMRRAYRSPLDGAPAELGVYAPPSYDPSRKWPLIIALHGLDGYPMSMLRWFFGFDEEGKEQPWEERHPAVLPALDAIVVAPNGHGNTMYRELGEDDILSAVAWAKAHYAIDDARITVTGPSMGGIGAAAVALHHPDVFAAAEPLCGYHSYFVRRDIATRPRRPWEEHLAEERSNVFWAENGRFLPMFIVHGTRDLPTLNSDVLIERYKRLGFDMTDEHPDLGHWVWQYTYGNLRGAKWLLGKRKRGDAHHVELKTASPRFADRGFVHLDALRDVDTWGTVDATLKTDGMAVKTSNVRAMRLDLPPRDSASTTVTIDGASLTFDGVDVAVVHRDDSGWKKGPLEDGQKHGRVAGPIRDVFHEPIVFVWGASDHDGAAANEAVARGFAKIRPGIDVHYPVMSDVEFIARGEKLEQDRALFLVGNAKENALVRELEKDFPIRVDGDGVKLGAKTLRSEEIGTMFIRPNPRHPSTYVVVVEAPTPVGTMRALSLPDILPDFVVWDRHVAPSRYQLILGAGALLAGGRFNNDWSLPFVTDDPLAKTTRPTPRNEYEATPYLP